MEEKKIKIIKSENLNEILNLRKMIVSCLPNLKKKATKAYLKNKIKNKEGGIIKAVLKKKVLGFLAWLKESESTAYIWWLIVEKKYQRNHLGSKLMREALKEFKKRGFKKVWAKIKNDNFSALSLVIKFHFFIEGISNEDQIFTVIVAKNLSKKEVRKSG
jgi:ribosomal protein S18 acetylase RimI-like enzyme